MIFPTKSLNRKSKIFKTGHILTVLPEEIAVATETIQKKAKKEPTIICHIPFPSIPHQLHHSPFFQGPSNNYHMKWWESVWDN